MTKFISTGSTYWISDEEIQILEKNATNGDKNSAFKSYQYHMFVSLDQDLEFKWLEIAAKNGHPIAQSNLADLFFTLGNKEKAIFFRMVLVIFIMTKMLRKNFYLEVKQVFSLFKTLNN